jgi:hypothetical protein
METEYVDDDEYINVDTIITEQQSRVKKPFDEGLIFINPEEIEKKVKEQEKIANPEFNNIIVSLEQDLNRPLTEQEYLKTCNIYAAILIENDNKHKKEYEGKINISPIQKERYVKMLLNNQPVKDALRIVMEEYEDEQVQDVTREYDKFIKNHSSEINVKEGNRINLKYKGKCRIASDKGGKIIIIDNKKDVDLLQQKYRFDWLNKKYPQIKNMNTQVFKREDDEFE